MLKRCVAFLLATLVVSISSSMAAASVPTLWKTAPLTFSNEAEMKSLMRQKSHDMKQTYYLILKVYNQGLKEKRDLIKKMAMTYHQMRMAAAGDPYLQSAFAFSFYMARDYNFEQWPKRDAELEKYSGDAEFCRRNSASRLPANAAVLLMAARPQFFRNAYGFAGVIPDMRQGIVWAKQAIKLDRRWAEPYFWVGMMLRFYSSNNIKITKEQKILLSKQAIPYYQNCLRLGKGYVEPGCWYGLAACYEEMRPGQPRVVLSYLDRYISTLSAEERKRPTLIHWRAEVIMEINGRQVTG